MSPIIPSRYGHPKYNVIPQKTRGATSVGSFKAAQRGTDPKSRRKQRVEENKVTIQSAEDEDADNFFSKHLAAARFQRNHRLINVLFSEVIVELEQPTDNDKLEACKKRVKSLTEYQKKISDEIVELDEKFKTKKAKIVEDGEKFAGKLNEIVTNSKKDLETLRAAQELRRQQSSINKQQSTTANNNNVSQSACPVDDSSVRQVLDRLVNSVVVETPQSS